MIVLVVIVLLGGALYGYLLMCRLDRFIERRGFAKEADDPAEKDILLYGERIVTQEELIIPHPGMRERKFVLLPLIELDAGLKDPVSGRLFLEYLAQLPPQGIYPLGQGIYDAPCP